MQKRMFVSLFFALSLVLSGCQTAASPFVRDTSKPILFEEASDIECPYCKTFHPVVEQLQKDFPNTVQFRYIYFPLEAIHPDALLAAEATECVRVNDGEDTFRKFLSEAYKASNLKKESLLSIGKTVGAKEETLKSCLETEATKKTIKADIEEGTKRGVTGTPTIFINGEKVEDRQYEKLYAELKKLEAQASVSPSVSTHSPSLIISPSVLETVVLPSVSEKVSPAQMPASSALPSPSAS